MISKNSENSFFIIDNDKVQINPKVLLIPEFAYLYERDHSQYKKKVLKEFAYIHYVADYKSEYNAYGLTKNQQIALDIFGNKKYKPDQYVLKAIDKYQDLQKTSSMRYLESIRNRVDRVIAFLDNADQVSIDKEGIYINPFLTIDKVTKVLNELEDVVEKLEKWEKKVFEEEEDMQIRGGGILNAFEDPENAKWIVK